MNKHLLHLVVEKVLIIWVGSFVHDFLEVVEEAPEHLPVDGRKLQPLPPGLERPLFTLQLLQPGP